MSTANNPADLDQERELLEDELLPELDDELEGHRVAIESGRHQDEFQEVVSGEKSFDEYSLPTLQTPEFGVVYPEYFIIKDESDVDYEVAIEPHTKYIQVRNNRLKEPLQEFAEKWKEHTKIEEISLGRADTSKVSFTGGNSSTTFAERF